MTAQRKCKVDDCARPSRSRSFCTLHYERLVRNGTTDLKPKLTLEEMFWSHVDKSGACWEWTGSKTKKGYGMYQKGWRGKSTTAHRFAYELSVGPIPDGMQIDHTCHNRACVNPGHLRPATNKQNNENPAGVRSDNTSGYRGVYFDKKMKRWCARAEHHGKTIRAGFYEDLQEAAEAARQLRLSLFTHNDADRKPL